MPQSKKDSSDWEQGYGYQIWRSRHHSYRADGAFGQYILVLPGLDAVIAITEETSNMQDELNLVWDYLLPAFKKNKTSRRSKIPNRFESKISTLALVPESGSFTSLNTNKNLIKYFVLEPNENHISSISIQIRDSICHFILNTGTDTYDLFYGAGPLENRTDK